MPLYEYQCESCDVRFERIQKFSDPPVDICPSCGGRVRKLFSSPAIQFKGSGFYINDYAKKSGGSSDGDGKAVKPAKDKDSSSSSTSEGGGSASNTTPSTSTPAKKDPA